MYRIYGFPGGAVGKESACNARRHRRCGFNPWVGKSPGGEHGNPFQYFYLENPMDRGVWWVNSPWDRKELDMTEATEYA